LTLSVILSLAKIAADPLGCMTPPGSERRVTGHGRHALITRRLKSSLRNQPKAPKDESFGVEAFLADAPGGRR